MLLKKRIILIFEKLLNRIRKSVFKTIENFDVYRVNQLFLDIVFEVKSNYDKSTFHQKLVFQCENGLDFYHLK